MSLDKDEQLQYLRYVVLHRGKPRTGGKSLGSSLREVKEETGITKLALYSSNTFDQIYSPGENSLYITPVFVSFIEENQDVRLNNEHSGYKWLSFEEAKEFVTLPGNRGSYLYRKELY
ncbi:NUDIX domain-containing protein [Niallia circulans]|uniref:NUDIX domain-containing protein n=1 Tax=Niallia circulans TaxID=1397 RepID=UPI0026EBADBA|nr:NUDIX domain-containing protein [Niallia circulans]